MVLLGFCLLLAQRQFQKLQFFEKSVNCENITSISYHYIELDTTFQIHNILS